MVDSAKPFLKWAGGKSRLGPFLAEHVFAEPLEPGARYYEPFMGAGGSALYAVREGHVQPWNLRLSDVNSRLVNAFNDVALFPAAVWTALDMLARDAARAPCPKEYFYRVRAEFNSALEEPMGMETARLIWLNKSCFNGLYRENSKGEFNVPFGTAKPSLPTSEDLLAVGTTLFTASIRAEPFQWAMDRAGRENSRGLRKDVVYCDPPYTPFPGTKAFQAYHKSSNRWNPRLLVEAARKTALRGSVVFISDNLHEASREQYRDLELVGTVAARRSISARGKRLPVQEGLWRMGPDSL